MVIPYPDVEGGELFCRVKPDNPPVFNDKQPKYLSPKGSTVRAYIPAGTRERLNDPKTTLVITEGEKKAAKAIQEGFHCIGLGGIWGFSQNHQLIPDLAEIRWEGRDIYIAPDSDHRTNPSVKLAVFTLERWLARLGVSVLVIRIPSSEDGNKVGLDDFLIANGPDALQQLMQEANPALFWEIEDIANQETHKRLKQLKSLFRKFNDLEPIEIPPWKNLCSEKLGICTAEFKAQLKVSHQEKQLKDTKDFDVDKALAEIQREKEKEPEDLAIKAMELLQDPSVLYKAGQVVHQLSVAGEGENICILYLAVTSRITDGPLSITVKGESSSGKSHLVEKTCQLFPQAAYIKMTGMSHQTLVYSDESYAHRTVTICERPGMEAADYNIRTLQSEGRIIFETVIKDPITNKFHTQRIEKEGPTNFIITTTSPELHPENETRHWSLLTDESADQTSAAKMETTKRYNDHPKFPEDELLVWRQLQGHLLSLRVCIPYAPWLAEHTPDAPLRMRRDYNKLLALVEVIALLHQYQRNIKNDMLIAGLEDYFIARELISKMFDASLTGINKKIEALVSEVQCLYREKVDAGEEFPAVKPAEIARALGTSSSSVSRWLRPAIETGLVEVIRETGKGRITSVKPGVADGRVVNPLPIVDELAEAFPDLAVEFRTVHPLTGEEVTLADTTREKEVEKIIIEPAL